MKDEYERHNEAVRERMEVLRVERPDEDDWMRWSMGHEAGECVECDAVRALATEDDE